MAKFPFPLTHPLSGFSDMIFHQKKGFKMPILYVHFVTASERSKVNYKLILFQFIFIIIFLQFSFFNPYFHDEIDDAI